MKSLLRILRMVVKPQLLTDMYGGIPVMKLNSPKIAPYWRVMNVLLGLP